MSETQYPGDGVVGLVEELEDIIRDARTPLGRGPQFKVIETEQVLNILAEIRMNFPDEWQQARRIVKEREEMLKAAAAQADSIVSDAQQQAITIASEQEIVRLAQQQADEVREKAQQYERETRYAAEDYAEQVFTHLEENLKSLTGTVARCRQQLNDSATSNNQNQNGAW